MKSRENVLQFSIISLTCFLFIAVTFLAIGTATQLSKTSLLESNQTTLSNIQAPLSYENHIAKGDSFMQSHYYAQAATQYALAIGIQEENPSAYAKLGSAYSALNEEEKALENHKIAWQISPNNQNYATHYAVALMHNYEFEDAQGVLLAVGENDQEALFYSAMLDAFDGDHTQARTKLEKSQNLNGSIPSYEINNFLSSYELFDRQQDGQDIYLNALLTEAMIDSEEYQLAETLAKDVLNEKNDYGDVWRLLGFALLKTNQFQDAEDAFKQAILVNSLKAENHYFLGMSYYYQEEYEDAVRSFELALLHHFQPEVELYRKLAESQLAIGAYEDALAAYEYLIRVDHSNLDLFVTPIFLSIEQFNDLNRALSLAQESVSVFPQEAQSYSMLAWVYLEREEYDEAKASINEALRLDSNLPDAHYNAGQLALETGDEEKALSSFKRATELSPPGSAIGIDAAEQYNALISGN